MKPHDVTAAAALLRERGELLQAAHAIPRAPVKVEISAGLAGSLPRVLVANGTELFREALAAAVAKRIAGLERDLRRLGVNLEEAPLEPMPEGMA